MTELFIFLQMGGDIDQVELRPIQGYELNPADFEVHRTACSVSADRARLLETIEAGTGTLAAFNRMMREALEAIVARFHLEQRRLADGHDDHLRPQGAALTVPHTVQSAGAPSRSANHSRTFPSPLQASRDILARRPSPKLVLGSGVPLVLSQPASRAASRGSLSPTRTPEQTDRHAPRSEPSASRSRSPPPQATSTTS